MNSFDWQTQLQKRQQRTKYERIAAIIAIALILGLCMWQIFFKDSPEYALEELSQALQNKNTAAVETYCDLDKVTSYAYDDLTKDMFLHDETLSDKTKVMFEQFYVKIKPEIVSETNQLLLSYVQYGSWQEPAQNNILKGRQLGIDYEYLIERSQLRNTQFVKVEEITRGNEVATAKVKVLDKYTNTTFNLILEMQKNEGTWQVTRIVNYRAYLDFLTPIQESGLNNYIAATKPIIEKYNDILDTQQTHFRGLNKTTDGTIHGSQRTKVADYICTDIIPALQKRQQELDAIEVPDGGQYLCSLRQKANDLSLRSWEYFSDAITKDDPAAFNTANALHKEAMDVEYRIDDILKNTAISPPAKTMP